MGIVRKTVENDAILLFCAPIFGPTVYSYSQNKKSQLMSILYTTLYWLFLIEIISLQQFFPSKSIIRSTNYLIEVVFRLISHAIHFKINEQKSRI